MVEIKILLLPVLQDMITLHNNFTHSAAAPAQTAPEESQQASRTDLLPYLDDLQENDSSRSLLNMSDSSYLLSLNERSFIRLDNDYRPVELEGQSDHGVESEISSVQIFKSRQTMRLEQHFSQFYKCFKKVNPACPDFKDAVEEVEEEIRFLDEDIQDYDSFGFKRVKRMGLSRIRKTFLSQNQNYLKGLLKFT